MSSQRPWKLPELERSLVVQTSFEVEVGVASDGVLCEADLSFILWKVGDPPQMLSLDTFSCAPWRSTRHVWEIIRDHKIYQAENFFSFSFDQVLCLC